MKPVNWIFDFISKDILASKSISKDLLAKASGEFSLLCFILNEESRLPKKYLKLLKIIDNKNILPEYHGIFTKYCLENTIDFQSIRKSDAKGLEIDYIKSIFYNENHNWFGKFLFYLKDIESKGIGTANTYYLTHIIFYSTHFGSNDYWNEQLKMKTLCLEVLSLCIDKYNVQKNWDLLRELYLCQLYMDNNLIDHVKQVFDRENRSIKSKQGWYLSDGNRLNHYETHYSSLTSEEKYSLYHTTIISLILEITIEKMIDDNMLAHIPCSFSLKSHYK